ncbi:MULTISPECIES: DUF3761 domain-containing protein [unclassified Caballeronia]|uniref:DUF3761 domain-containing protein n=1 Tax=unclassified Caballeronia TaxID=2646786 RepID=UPI002854E6E6|nr:MULTISPECIES: DUF3761 domain-containing protein [unclassified Caballeronia]MDR5772624.1 DUF3761 domain-containing protein [Caballeronia sp. LZ002]MDR5848058.1 DUF3761 domain-containing protein [Caballeronia sp. LZ003]
MKGPAFLRSLAATCCIALSASVIPCTPANAYANSANANNFNPQPDENDLDRHGHYVNRDGNVIHAPSRSRSGAVPEGATAQCRDGSYSFSRHHGGTCSRHGGVARWQ